MTKVSAEISNGETKGKITLDNIEEKFEEIEQGMHVKLKNGTERELPLKQAVEEMWGMLYEIRNATEVLVDINKTWKTLKKYKNGLAMTFKVIGLLVTLSVVIYYGVDIKQLVFKWLGIDV